MLGMRIIAVLVLAVAVCDVCSVVDLEFNGVDVLRELYYTYQPAEEPVLDHAQKKQQGPFQLLSQWKNPCWLWEEKFLCVPYFYVMGFRKCATSDYYARLTLHPQVVQPWRKETYWITHHRRIRPLEDYADWFGARMYVKGQQDPQNFVLGDGDPNVVWHFQSQPAKTTPVPQLLKRISPYAKYKFIVLMRQPSKRVYSDYLYSVPEPTPTAFHVHVLERIEAYSKCFRENTSVRSCVYDEANSLSGDEKTGVMLGHSIYVAYVHDWLRQFSRKNFLFLETGDYSVNMERTLRETIQFIGLDPLDNATLAQMCALAKVNSNTIRDRVGDMFPETRLLLDQFFKPFNDALAILLGSEKFVWPSAAASGQNETATVDWRALSQNWLNDVSTSSTTSSPNDVTTSS